MPFGHRRVEVGLILQDAMFVNGIICNSEAWHGISQKIYTGCTLKSTEGIFISRDRSYSTWPSYLNQKDDVPPKYFETPRWGDVERSL